jgi:hypothetical protein
MTDVYLSCVLVWEATLNNEYSLRAIPAVGYAYARAINELPLPENHSFRLLFA